MELIDKAAVVAEIERRKHKLLDNIMFERDKEWVVRTAHQLNRIILFLDDLEVKEVDLEKEITHYFKGWGNNEIHCFAMMQDGTSVGIDECIDIAKHFFELGIAVSNKA